MFVNYCCWIRICWLSLSLSLSQTVISELMVLFFGAILCLSKWEILAFMVQEKEASIRKLQAIQDYVMSFESQVQFHFSLSLYYSPFTTKSWPTKVFSAKLVAKDSCILHFKIRSKRQPHLPKFPQQKLVVAKGRHFAVYQVFHEDFWMFIIKLARRCSWWWCREWLLSMYLPLLSLRQWTGCIATSYR
jgi:hypothetical protein